MIAVTLQATNEFARGASGFVNATPHVESESASMRRTPVGDRAVRRGKPRSAESANPKNEIAEAEDRTRATRRVRPPWIVAIIGVAALVAFVATTDRGRAATDALEECEDYAATLKRCFGDTGSFRAPAPPSTKEGRAAAAKRCTADRVRIERACR